jgi:hypothetical protein
MGVEKRTLIRAQSKHQLRIRRHSGFLVSSGNLRGIENIGNRAENDHQPGAKKGEDPNHDDGEHGNDQCILDQRLAFFAARSEKAPQYSGYVTHSNFSHAGLL